MNKDIALLAARKLIAGDRQIAWDCYTIGPLRSFEQMDADELAEVLEYDRVLSLIDAAFSSTDREPK